MSSHFTKAARNHLYRYKRYDDVRLAFAPSSKWPSSAVTQTTSNILGTISISAFSGLYENDQPAKIELSQIQFRWA